MRNSTHLVDGSCQRDWFAVCSVVEHLLGIIKATKPTVTRAILRSDEARCYHNNNLIVGIRDVSERTGIQISRYDFSEPQYGKDVCDRMLCPMKTTIQRYCNEGHDVLLARDTYAALSERPVKGTSVCVCSIRQKYENLQVNKIDGFSKYHNFMYEEKGVRVWKVFEVGPGKLIVYDQLYNAHQGPTSLSVQGEFFPFDSAAIVSPCFLSESLPKKWMPSLSVRTLAAEKCSRSLVSWSFILMLEITTIENPMKLPTTN